MGYRAGPHPLARHASRRVKRFTGSPRGQPFTARIATFSRGGLESARGLSILASMKRQSGFNIIELMVAIAVFGVLLGVGIPGVESYIQNGRMTTQINSLSTALSHARSEAIKLNQRVVVCVSANGTACDAVGAGNGWNKGWLVFVDRNANGVLNKGGAGVDDCAVGATTDCLISRQSAFDGANTLTPAASVQDVLVYVGDGSVRCNTDSSLATLESCPNATTYFTLCDFRGAAHAKAVGISNTGRISSLDKQPNGSALTCP